MDGTADESTLRSLIILSQDAHTVYGGVVPEIASRMHLASLVPVVDRAIEGAGIDRSAIDAVAVTVAPGLVGALLVGVSYAKALAFAIGRPLIAVHHLEAHLFATSIEHPQAVPPFTGLLVSGGHTMLIDVRAWGDYTLLGATRDDAAGEAFDKVAKLLGLPYPGGRHVETLARQGNPSRFHFSRPMLRSNQEPDSPDYFDFSFSGIKTAVMNAVRTSLPAGAAGNAEPPADSARADIARGFQDAVIDTLVEKTMRGAMISQRQRIVLGGGVACNQALVGAMRDRASSRGIDVFAPTPRLATDNAAMIARTGLFHLAHGRTAPLDQNAYATQQMPGLRNGRTVER